MMGDTVYLENAQTGTRATVTKLPNGGLRFSQNQLPFQKGQEFPVSSHQDYHLDVLPQASPTVGHRRVPNTQIKVGAFEPPWTPIVSSKMMLPAYRQEAVKTACLEGAVLGGLTLLGGVWAMTNLQGKPSGR
ncbi:MAG: hypothetical protein ACKO37_06390 [Vampirovibrionales bacterium]